ncbi:polysaccharide biosynthesis protein [Serratia fonticola]|uniref:hypothetical protein n=1 Tax=Serratia fonticola TaxID=47917 RepID=UPI0021775663|nr:hypothetical protein [Serratia fonticola]CAI1955036.1 Uncharacterised protein [Serratia fonticola]
MKLSVDLISLLKDTTIIGSSRIFVMVYNIGIIFLLTKNEYGMLSYYDYIAQFCLSVSNFGLTSVLMKDLATKDKEFVLTNFMWIKVSGILIISIAWHGYLILNGSDAYFILVNFIYTLVLCFIFDWYLISTERSKNLAKYYLCYVLMTTLCTAILYFNNHLNALTIRYLQIVATVISFIIFCRGIFGEVHTKHFSLPYIKDRLRQGGYILCVQFMQNSVLTLTTTAIKFKYGYAGLAPFSIALRFCQVVVSFRNMTIGPITKFLLKKEKGFYKKIIGRYFASIILLFSIYMIVVYFYGENIAVKFWGDERIWISIMILSFVPLWNILFIFDGIMININRKQKFYFYSTLCSFIIFISAYYLPVNNFYYYALIYVAFESIYAWSNHVFVVRKL